MTTLRDITFAQFKAAVNTDDVKQTRDTYVAFFNGVKCEIKKNRMTFGWKLSAEQREEIRVAIVNAGGTIHDKKYNDDAVEVYYSDDNVSAEDDIAEFVKFVNAVKALGFEQTWNTRRTYTGVNKTSLFVNIATVIKAAADTKMYAMIDRKVFDMVDDVIALNEKTETNNYREHVVPCVMLIDRAFEMFDDGATVTDVAVMLQQNLMVMHVPAAEAKRMDFELGLQTTMPAGWTFGDDPLARLKAAKII